MDQEWRCQMCNTLLGVKSGPRLHLRYKDVQYVVDGVDYSVIAVCRKCSTVNERSGRTEPPRSVAARG